MDILYEYRPSQRRRGRPVLLPPTNIIGKQGFISVYGFDNNVSEEITTKGGTYDLGERNLYSDILYIDIDNDKHTTIKVKDKLISMEISFKLYSSGSPDSYHFHIPIVPMYGVHIFTTQKSWVKQNFPDVDLSIYKPSGIIRIEGSYHSKYPGKQKELIFEYKNKKLNIKDKLINEVNIPVKPVKSSLSYTELENVLDNLIMTEAEEGNRNNEIYKRAFLFCYLGRDLQEAIKELTEWNISFCYPSVTNRELLTTIKSAYRRAKC